MKYAFFPGCVAKGGTPELYDSAKIVMERLNIETVELTRASCTGAGVLQEKDQAAPSAGLNKSRTWGACGRSGFGS